MIRVTPKRENASCFWEGNNLQIKSPNSYYHQEKLHKMTHWTESHSSEKEGSSFPGSMSHARLPSSIPITCWVIHSYIHPIMPSCIIHAFPRPLLCPRLHMEPWTCYTEWSPVGTDENVADVRLYSFIYILMSLGIQPRISELPMTWSQLLSSKIVLAKTKIWKWRIRKAGEW